MKAANDKYQIRFDESIRSYHATCGNICNNLYIENINKRLVNNFNHTNVGNHETYIIDTMFQNHTFKRDEKIGAFFPDFVDYENKKYDIAVLLYKDVNDDYIVLDYVYGADNYRNELEVLIDNSNIVESYPGVSLPLTCSFVNAVPIVATTFLIPLEYILIASICPSHKIKCFNFLASGFSKNSLNTASLMKIEFFLTSAANFL